MTAAVQAAAALAAVLFGLVASAALDLGGRRTPAHFLRLLACFASTVFAVGVARLGPVDLAIGPWLQVGGAGLGLNLRADGIAAAAVGSAAALCLLFPLAQPAMDRIQRALMTASAAGAVLLSCAADWLPLLMGWEIAAAALLVTAARSRSVSGAGARRLLLLTRMGSVALAAAAVTSLAAGAAQGGVIWTAAPAVPLLTVAALTGLGLWPLHQWLLELSPCPPARAAAAALTLAGAVLLSRVSPGLGTLQPVVFGAGLIAAAAGAAAALASPGLHRIPAWISVAHAGLVAAAMAADPQAGWLMLGAALCARLCLAAGAGLVQAGLPAAERLDELRGLAVHLPAARWLCLAGALVPVLSLAGLWGQAVLLQHSWEAYGAVVLWITLLVIALTVPPVVRFALVPFAGTAPGPAPEKAASPTLPALAGGPSAVIAFAALPLLSWWWLAPPTGQGLVLAAAAGAAALGVSVLIWRRGLDPAPGPASAARRLAAGGLGAGTALRGISGAAATLGRGLWTCVDTALIGGGWGGLDLAVRSAGWLLARAHRHRPVGAVALAAGTALAVLWSMGGR